MNYVFHSAISEVPEKAIGPQCCPIWSLHISKPDRSDHHLCNVFKWYSFFNPNGNVYCGPQVSMDKFTGQKNVISAFIFVAAF